MHVQRTNPMGQCCSYMYLCMVSSEGYMRTGHAQGVVVKRNTCTEDACNNT